VPAAILALTSITRPNAPTPSRPTPIRAAAGGGPRVSAFSQTVFALFTTA
jgi:hypothetical protein